MNTIPGPILTHAMSKIIDKYKGVLTRMGDGPTNHLWPCPHQTRDIEPTTKREYCLDCYHWTTP